MSAFKHCVGCGEPVAGPWFPGDVPSCGEPDCERERRDIERAEREEARERAARDDWERYR